MRVAVAGFMHESNTFATGLTTLEQFQAAHFDLGPALLDTWSEAHHELGGFIQGCADNKLEIVPILAAWATPGGPVSHDTYESIVEQIIEGLSVSGPIDGLLLALHGAMVAEHILDADRETIERIRKALGRETPIVLSLDMHANISQRMVAAADATVAYRTYPHVDQRARGLECAGLIQRIIGGKVEPVQAFVKLPLLIHIVQQYTGAGAMAGLMRALQETIAAPGILSASIAPGYIYADVPDMGVSVIVVGNADEALADDHARKLAAQIFAQRAELNASLPGVREAIQEVAAAPGPVCLMDSGDNIGGGGPGDATFILEELLEQGVTPFCTILYDPEAVAVCEAAGVGARVEIEVGAKTDRLHGDPIPIRGEVHVLSDGLYTEPEPRHGGQRFFDQGHTAVVRTEKGDTFVLNSLRVMPTSLQQLLSLGIDPSIFKAITVKGVTAPLAAYDPVVSRIIAVDSPGVTQAGPESFVYHRRPRPLYPLEPDCQWSPKAPPSSHFDFSDA